mmetsp:Transcript_12959/g.39895  ORF Transcript_12959/g.39895 Transcript_12959/m.39895 type:complete len:271 (-) Transcript_12959:673-1485(-)|eukprot:CAMPEP_0198723554 /NCGR_PEP_ID=MMETSP1475-20131203/1072_1 /TAXON_ID= ORGANISM="Unidentified sp., Strain CCMP1999" /NCGR_SAMPLE_ID=MMETSP1475 /ASSEMBLY_ACC=CAM_ASM_001111 /LENGTH=270 /DNA_ID=CAMNT_0044484735 /DNA_START=61 /DNA_END=870 /DNA_ORIENTATION=+
MVYAAFLSAGSSIQIARQPRMRDRRRYKTKATISSPCVSGSTVEDGTLEVKDLSLTWDNGRKILRDISLTVPKGQFCMVVGPNGCGKSTLLRIIANLVFPDRGTVLAPKPVGIVFQDPSEQMLFPSVYMEVFSGNDAMVPYEERLNNTIETMKSVGIMDIAAKSTLDLSGGQKQRVATATMLVRQPQLMLFDEVTASLDPESRAGVLQLVRKILRERNIAGIWVTHVYEELPYADRIVVLKDGRIHIDGTYEHVCPRLKAMWADYGATEW